MKSKDHFKDVRDNVKQMHKGTKPYPSVWMSQRALLAQLSGRRLH